MEFKDFMDNKFNNQDPADLTKLIDFLEEEENLERLFQFWNSLENRILPASTSDEIYEGVIEGTSGIK
ncbi:MAG: hypothetical protein M3421_12435 [Bacteroidota bacterium]|jgi:hypothetical protein|nr:hypothetical protein [Bacteroidota bacterium]